MAKKKAASKKAVTKKIGGKVAMKAGATKKSVAKKVTKKTAQRSARAKSASPEFSPKERWGRRADLGAEVGGYLEALPDDLRDGGRRLHDMIMKAAPEATSAIKWGMPVYQIGKVMFANIWKGKGYLRLGLYSGAGLQDPRGLLAGDGKDHRHVRIAPANAPWAAIEDLIQQSIAQARLGAAQ